MFPRTCWLLLTLLFAATIAAAAERKPNIVLILADDLRHDLVHSLGPWEVQTPHLDALVARGTAFTQAHIMGGSHPAVCMPSRAMLMTGRTLFHLQDRGATIPPSDRMLPEALRAAGYRTHAIGKWHNGRPSFARAWDSASRVFFGGMTDHFAVPLWDFDPAGKYPPGTAKIVRGRHSSELLADSAVEFLNQQQPTADTPFFLYLAFLAPHDPRLSPPEYRENYQPGQLKLPENFLPEHPFDNGELQIRDELLLPHPRTPEAVRRELADYYAIITHLDAQVGRVFQALREHHLEENTIVVFASDNGLAVGQHGLLGKQSVYDHSVRVPLILAGPGIPAGEKRDALCYLGDLYPTLCDLAGAPAPATNEMQSFLPVIRDKHAPGRAELLLAYRDFQRAVRDDRWKLIEYRVQNSQKFHLFDLAKDAWEKQNLADIPEHAATLERLKTRLQSLQKTTGDHP